MLALLTTENLEKLLAVVGAVGALASVLAAVLPASWRVTRVLARCNASGHPTALVSAVDLLEQTAGAAAWTMVASLAGNQALAGGANATAGTVWSANTELRRAA